MMIIYVILVFIISLNSIVSQTDKLNVGIILDVEDKTSRKIIDIIMENSNTLKSQIEIFEDRNAFNALQKTCNLLSKGVAGVIDVSNKYLSKQVSSVLNKFQIPHFMAQCQVGESYGNNLMNIPMYPDCKQYSEIIYKYITEKEMWSEVMIIYSAKDYFLKFEHLFNTLDIRFKVRKWSHENMGDNKPLLKDLSKFTNVLVDIPFWQIQNFLTMALLHNMNGPRKSFIFTDLDTHHLDLRTFPEEKIFNIKAFSLLYPLEAYDRQYGNTTVKDLVDKINKIENEVYNLKIRNGLMVRSGILMDSVNLLVKAIDKIQGKYSLNVSGLQCTQKNKVWETGSTFLAEIKKIKLTERKSEMKKVKDVNDPNQGIIYNLSVMKWTKNGFQETDRWLDNKFISSWKAFDAESAKDGKVLRVTTIEALPFTYYKGNRPRNLIYDSNINAWDGFCIDLLKEISSDLGMNFSIHLVKDHRYGTITKDDKKVQKWTGMIGEVISQKADLAVAPLTVTDERKTVVDFTQPFMNVGLTVLYLKPTSKFGSIFSFLSPFTPKLWLYIILAYAIASLIIFAMILITPYKCHGCIPRSYSTKVASVMWWLFTTIVVCTYTANMAANFIERTSGKLNLPIKSFEDLSRQTNIAYGTVKGGSSYSFFEKSSISTFQNMFYFMKNNPESLVSSVQEGVDRVLNSDGKYAFILESSMNDYYVSKDCRLMRIGELMDSKNYAIALPNGSFLKKSISKSILKLENAEKLLQLKKKWFRTSNLSQSCDNGKTINFSGLYSNYLLGLFYILWIVMIIALLISIIELYVDFRNQKGTIKGPFYQYLKNKIIAGWKQKICFNNSKGPKATLNDTEKIKTTDKKEDYEISESLKKTSAKDQSSSNPQIVIVPDSGSPITGKA